MSNNNIEQQILDAAKQLFFAQGRFKATSQEIADYAKVPRTSINYYFRSVKSLFVKAKDEVLQQNIENTEKILLSAIPLKEKVSKFIDSMSVRLERYPYMEGVIMTEKNTLDEHNQNKSEVLTSFLKEVKAEMEKGTIPKYPPKLFLIHLNSLIVYPYFVQNMNRSLMGIDQQEYKKLMKQRKKVILEMLFPNN